MGTQMNARTSTLHLAALASLALGASALLLTGCSAGTVPGPAAAPAGDGMSMQMGDGSSMPMGDGTSMPAGPGSHTHGSRHTHYGSLAALAGDSVEIVTGTVVAQRVVTDLGPRAPATVSTVRVATVAKAADGLAAGGTVDVRQIGTAAQPGPAAMMQAGSTYLLYLRPSRLPGEAASQSFVTGGSAGLFGAPDPAAAHAQADTDAAEEPTQPAAFLRLDDDGGDTLPERVTADGALG